MKMYTTFIVSLLMVTALHAAEQPIPVDAVEAILKDAEVICGKAQVGISIDKMEDMLIAWRDEVDALNSNPNKHENNTLDADIARIRTDFKIYRGVRKLHEVDRVDYGGNSFLIELMNSGYAGSWETVTIRGETYVNLSALKRSVIDDALSTLKIAFEQYKAGL